MSADLRVSVVIPALNEQATVADVVTACCASGADEVLVIDSDSSDATAHVAARAGAKVMNWRDVDAREPWPGKGEALWRGVKAASGEVVVFIDADVTNVAPQWVDLLAAPFTNPAVHLVKAAYTRSLGADGRGGGRVTELTAKPLLRVFFPELADIAQPLAGEYAVRRSSALRLPFVSGYGVEVGMLIDVAQHHTRDAITEVALGSRTHRNRPLEELGPMADVVARTILARAGYLGSGDTAGGTGAALAQRPPWVVR